VTRRVAALVPVIAAALLGGCTAMAPRPPLPLEPRPVAAQAPAVRQTLVELQRRYIDPAAIDPPAMLTGGVQELGRGVRGLTIEEQDDAVILSMGDRRAQLSRSSATDIDTLAAGLDAAVAWTAAGNTGKSSADLQAAALRGAVRRVDRWGTVVTGSERDGLEGRFKGTMTGVGCQIGRRDDVPTVIQVYPGTPAAEAGLVVGDRVVAVDSTDVRDDKIEAIVGRLRGPAGTPVRVTVERAGDARDTLEMVRRPIALPTVASRMLAPDVGYLQVSHIAQNTGPMAERMIGGLREADGLRAVVLDLRGNTGGSILAAGHIADQFVDRGVLIETRGAGGQPVRGLQPRIDATEDAADRRPAAPIVILVDGRTGSSAELLAAALVRHDRAVLVGERTYGKGVVQKTVPVGPDGELLLKVTVARSYAAGVEIPHDGLLPDVQLEAGDAPAGSRCAAATWDAPGAVAAVGVPGDAGDDGAIAAALDLIQRYPATSREDLRRALFRDLCAGAGTG